MPDYVPNSDASFDYWQDSFADYLTAHLADFGLVAGDVALVTSARTVWTNAYVALGPARAAARAATQAKIRARADYEVAARAIVRRIAGLPTLTDAQRASLGITVPDTEGTPVGAPASRPTCIILSGERLRHTLEFRDAATPNRKAKPAGTMGCEIWVKVLPVGDAVPSDPAAFAFLALDTATPYVAEVPGADGGKNAHYRLRWVSTRGDKGPWSEVFSATIGA